MSSPILRYFDLTHLPNGPLRQVSARFADLAVWVDESLPDGAEKSTALRKLIEAKDAAVRAALDLIEKSPFDVEADQALALTQEDPRG
jgi:hypothetical protein